MTETPAFDITATRIAALAARLDISPRSLLAFAARIAAIPETPLDAARLQAELDRFRNAGAATDEAAALLLLGYGAYVQGHLNNGLSLAWSDPLGVEG
jgi:hypothetical protein